MNEITINGQKLTTNTVEELTEPYINMSAPEIAQDIIDRYKDVQVTFSMLQKHSPAKAKGVRKMLSRRNLLRQVYCE